MWISGRGWWGFLCDSGARRPTPLIADKPCSAIRVGPGVSPPFLGSRVAVGRPSLIFLGLPLLADSGDVDTALWIPAGMRREEALLPLAQSGHTRGSYW